MIPASLDIETRSITINPDGYRQIDTPDLQTVGCTFNKIVLVSLIVVVILFLIGGVSYGIYSLY